MGNSYQEWIKRAEGNLNLAKESHHDGIYLEDLCFQAQQAAEKALKAVLIFLKIEPPRTHNFNMLLFTLEKEIEIPETIKEVIDLNEYAIHTRYPGDYSPVEEKEYLDSIKNAENVVNWASDFIQNKVNQSG